MKARFGEMEFRGDDALVVHGLSKAYGDRTLFHDLELQVTGGERIALLGDNGAGKTTLLHVLTGREPGDRGVVKFGPSVKWAMLEQQIRFERMDRNLVDTMLYEGGCSPQEARDRLGAFGFSGEDAFKWVTDLSGGELSRLRLCILMKTDVNFLILDEPTNHLDIMSREWIEDALEDYGEALLLVSHDRYFIRRFATRIWELRDGELLDYRCGYDEYRERKERREQVARAEKKQENGVKPKKKASGPSPERRRALLEKQIQETEDKAKETERLIEENATDYQRLEELFRDKAELERQIEDLYARWDAVE